MVVLEPPLSCKVYTPKPLASAMVRAVAQNGRQRWLEPSCGTGVFLEALSEIGVPRNRVVGVDLDTTNYDADQLGTVTRGLDFLNWSRTRGGRFDCVVGNPPYVPIQRLPGPLKKAASEIRDLNGRTIGDRANTWYPFLVRAIKTLRIGGSMAFVLPAACEYADYASVGRAELTSIFDRVDLIRSQRPLFDDVAEGVVVLVARGKGGSGRLYRRHEVENVDLMVRKLHQLSELKARSCPNSSRCRTGVERMPCREVLDIRIGGVTGDADYFLLTETQRKAHGVPKSALVPVVSRSKHVVRGVHTEKDWHNLLEANEKVWLFSPRGRILTNPAVQRYLDLEEDDGGCHKERYKVRIRDPWYNTPMPEEPDAFLSGMSTTGLWMCMNEFQRLTATNTLYVATFRGQHPRAQKYAWALSMLTSIVQKQVARAKRVYADGLSKLEPGQIANLELPVPPPISNAVSEDRKAVDIFLRGGQREAARIADNLILG